MCCVSCTIGWIWRATLPPRIPRVANIAFREPPLNVTQEVLRVLNEVLSLNGRSAAFTWRRATAHCAARSSA